MSKQTATTPFYTSENGMVTLWNDGKRRTMRVTIKFDTHTIDITSLSKDAVRKLADDLEALVVWVAKKTRAIEHKRHGRELLRVLSSSSEDD